MAGNSELELLPIRTVPTAELSAETRSFNELRYDIGRIVAVSCVNSNETLWGRKLDNPERDGYDCNTASRVELELPQMLTRRLFSFFRNNYHGDPCNRPDVTQDTPDHPYSQLSNDFATKLTLSCDENGYLERQLSPEDIVGHGLIAGEDEPRLGNGQRGVIGYIDSKKGPVALQSIVGLGKEAVVNGAAQGVDKLLYVSPFSGHLVLGTYPAAMSHYEDAHPPLKIYV